jgi:hypothetical protein
MADLDNAVLETDGEDDLLSDLRSAFKSEEAAPVEAEAATPELETPEVEEPKDDRSRDEKGRFAARIEKAQEPADVPAVAPVETPAVPAEPASDAAAQAVRPPPGWSPAAKVAFDSLPAEVRQAVANREIEVNKGFAKLSEYKPLDPYIDYARQNNTTLDRALQQYVGIEQLLKRDFVAGIETLCRNSQIDPVQLATSFSPVRTAQHRTLRRAISKGIKPPPLISSRYFRKSTNSNPTSPANSSKPSKPKSRHSRQIPQSVLRQRAPSNGAVDEHGNREDLERGLRRCLLDHPGNPRPAHQTADRRHERAGHGCAAGRAGNSGSPSHAKHHRLPDSRRCRIESRSLHRRRHSRSVPRQSRLTNPS